MKNENEIYYVLCLVMMIAMDTSGSSGVIMQGTNEIWYLMSE